MTNNCRILLLLPLLFIVLKINGQTITDTSVYKKMLSNALYNYDELGDSLLDYSEAFLQFSKKNNYPEAAIQALKLKGLHQEIKGNYDSALVYYLNAGNLAIEQNNEKAATASLFDRMSVYLEMQQYEQAKLVLYQALNESKKQGSKKLMSVAWSNLGIIYRRTGLTDSAYYAYQQSIQLKQEINDVVGMANTRTNYATLLISNNKYPEALQLLNQNIAFYRAEQRFGELCLSYISIADAWRSLNQIATAEQYIDSAMQLVNKYDMQQRLPILLNLQSAIAYQTENYKTAYELKDSATKLENNLITGETRRQITELNEKFKVKQKEQQNALLTSRLANQQLEQRNILIAGGALAIIATVALFAWFNIRRKSNLLLQKNRVIAQQNQQLTNLNADKNQLISMVSHDLGQPFNQLKVWTTLVEKKLENQAGLGVEEPIAHIKESIEQGQRLIHHVLDVEKAGANARNLSLQTVWLNKLLQNIADDFGPAADGKQIKLTVEAKDWLKLETDEQHLRQVLENLVSNALKFSNSGTEVCLKAYITDTNNLAIEVQDKGPGLDAGEMEIIFNKYAVAKTRPTAGEHSSGLGLSIVKRLMLELGGTVEVQSKKGEGACFRLIFGAANS